MAQSGLEHASSKAETHWIFAYGSNMCARDLRAWFTRTNQRRGRVLATVTATLRDFELSWNYYSRVRGGGAANVTPRHGAEVYGLALHVDGLMLSALDLKEGHPERYRRSLRGVSPLASVDDWHAEQPTLQTHLASLEAVASAGVVGSIDAWVYQVTPQFERVEFTPPNRDYLATVLGAARRFGFPDPYLVKLRSAGERTGGSAD